MLPSMMNQEYTLLRYPRVLDHGTEVIDYTASPTRSKIYGSLQPGTGLIDLVARDGAEIAYTLVARPYSGAEHDDQVEIEGKKYFVNGAPELWRAGIMNHDIIRFSRWVG